MPSDSIGPVFSMIFLQRTIATSVMGVLVHQFFQPLPKGLAGPTGLTPPLDSNDLLHKTQRTAQGAGHARKCGTFAMTFVSKSPNRAKVEPPLDVVS